MAQVRMPSMFIGEQFNMFKHALSRVSLRGTLHDLSVLFKARLKWVSDDYFMITYAPSNH